jgi:hypothetical protein
MWVPMKWGFNSSWLAACNQSNQKARQTFVVAMNAAVTQNDDYLVSLAARLKAAPGDKKTVLGCRPDGWYIVPGPEGRLRAMTARPKNGKAEVKDIAASPSESAQLTTPAGIVAKVGQYKDKLSEAFEDMQQDRKGTSPFRSP